MRPFHDARLAALESLYRRRFPHFLRVALAIAGDRERALEAVQDGFADAIRSRSSFRGEGPLEAWVWRAVVNAALKAARREERTDVLDTEPHANGHGPRVSSEVATLVALLPERQRLVVFLRYYADLDYRAIAEALGVEVGTVSAALSAAHSSLRRALGGVAQ